MVTAWGFFRGADDIETKNGPHRVAATEAAYGNLGHNWCNVKQCCGIRKEQPRWSPRLPAL